MKIYTTLGDGIEALELKEVPEPAIKPNEVLVKMAAVSLNYRDLLVVNGIEGWKPASPRIPLSDGAGEIVALGNKVTRFKVGDRVAGIFLPRWLDGELTSEKYVSPLGGAAADGVLAEYVAFDEEAVVGIPSHLSMAEAATLPVAAVTAWHAVVRRSGVRAGETVLIKGTGGVALFAVQFVRAAGGHPIVISSSDEKLEKVKALGAASGVNYRRFRDWEEKILELTGGRGVDHVVETIGGEELNRSLSIVKMSGTIAFIGLIAGLSAPINTYQFVTKNVRLHGIETGSREMFEEMNRSIETGRIKPVVDKIFDAAEIRSALKYLEKAGHFGKIALTF